MAAQTSRWVQLQGHNGNVYEFISLKPNEFITISRNQKTHRYDKRKNEFILDEIVSRDLRQCIGYDLRNGGGPHVEFAFDKDTQDLYVINICDIRERILSFNLESNQMTEFGMNDRFGFGIEAAYSYCTLFIKDHIHRISGYHTIRSLCHARKSHKLFSKLNTSFVSSRSGHSVVYVPSKECIILIGGDGHWESDDDIWTYSLATQEWKGIEHISFRRRNFGAALTSNERYIVLMGGKDDDDIHVLDIKSNDYREWKLKKCSIKCPEMGSCNCVRMGGVDSKDEMLVNGFIKDCFKDKDLNHLQLPPSYILKMIGEWYSAEMIHWLKSWGKDNHYAICLNDILSSLIK